ncbi:hypothetical protein ACFQI7_12525 [Paenibacillus allorhizosphaerae]|uniref:Uncharacterized protein n=1 Tax=Paenibacillus allorhizosphaerae TaxID=2849866 RepID=A0ABM8VLH0_9BACL|nr:hypothetical protein [Paenibacillus allorhizosphaerae]CAG7648526.1 hypothetical protein PAECIP111802_04236 [Paenibacillus allorhizosphaerae]
MRVNLKFTTKGQSAIENFNNDELIEIFTRYLNTLVKHYAVNVSVPVDMNQDIRAEGILKVLLENVNCDINIFFRELERDIKVPLKKRLDKAGKLDNVFKIDIIK